MPGTCSFTTKRLIDVFIYTQYAHKPNEKRQRQFKECLSQVFGKTNLLTYMFLVEVWQLSLLFVNAGRVIADWFGSYCSAHSITPDVLRSLRDEHSGLGIVERVADRRARVFREKTEELAMKLWIDDGRPDGGPSQFLLIAHNGHGKTMKLPCKLDQRFTSFRLHVGRIDHCKQDVCRERNRERDDRSFGPHVICS